MKGIKAIWVLLVVVLLAFSYAVRAAENDQSYGQYELHELMVSTPANCTTEINSLVRRGIGEIYVTVVCKDGEADSLSVQKFPRFVLNGSDRGYALMVKVPSNYTFQCLSETDSGLIKTQVMVKQVPLEQRLPVVKDDKTFFVRLLWGYCKYKLKLKGTYFILHP